MGVTTGVAVAVGEGTVVGAGTGVAVGVGVGAVAEHEPTIIAPKTIDIMATRTFGLINLFPKAQIIPSIICALG